MAYYNGQVSNYSQLANVLISACVDNGFTHNDSVIQKNGIFLLVSPSGTSLDFIARTSESAGAIPNILQIRNLSASGIPALTFPIDYEIFIFEHEVYLIVNYAIECYQYVAFGKSTIDFTASSGTGMYISASLTNESTNFNGISINNQLLQNSQSAASPAFNWSAVSYSTSASLQKNFWLHSNLDNHGWYPVNGTGATSDTRVGAGAVIDILNTLPSAWSGESVLVPIYCFKKRASSKVSLTADLQHARYIRIDNYEPKQIISLGSDRWKVFPFFRKNTAVRNGGSVIAHSGTYGWAIRYDGP